MHLTFPARYSKTRVSHQADCRREYIYDLRYIYCNILVINIPLLISYIPLSTGNLTGPQLLKITRLDMTLLSGPIPTAHLSRLCLTYWIITKSSIFITWPFGFLIYENTFFIYLCKALFSWMDGLMRDERIVHLFWLSLLKKGITFIYREQSFLLCLFLSVIFYELKSIFRLYSKSWTATSPNHSTLSAQIWRIIELTWWSNGNYRLSHSRAEFRCRTVVSSTTQLLSLASSFVPTHQFSNNLKAKFYPSFIGIRLFRFWNEDWTVMIINAFGKEKQGLSKVELNLQNICK